MSLDKNEKNEINENKKIEDVFGKDINKEDERGFDRLMSSLQNKPDVSFINKEFKHLSENEQENKKKELAGDILKDSLNNYISKNLNNLTEKEKNKITETIESLPKDFDIKDAIKVFDKTVDIISKRNGSGGSKDKFNLEMAQSHEKEGLIKNFDNYFEKLKALKEYSDKLIKENQEKIKKLVEKHNQELEKERELRLAKKRRYGLSEKIEITKDIA